MPRFAHEAGSPGAICVASVRSFFARTSSPLCKPANPTLKACTRSRYFAEPGSGRTLFELQPARSRKDTIAPAKALLRRPSDEVTFAQFDKSSIRDVALEFALRRRDKTHFGTI